MDEHYPIGITLLKIGGSNEESYVQAGYKEDCGWYCEPGNHFSRQWIEVHRGRVFVEVHFYYLLVFGHVRYALACRSCARKSSSRVNDKLKHIGHTDFMGPEESQREGRSVKYLFWVTFSFLMFVTAVVAQTTEAGSALKSLVETEQAFSKTAEDKSTREAFLQFIADDGILFRPTAVPGKQWLLDHPAPASQKHPLLAWQPVFAFVARAGDVGYTTGPWEFKGDIKDEKPAAYGDFITVWKKQSDGSWKFVVDLGISHPQSSGPLKLWKLSDRGYRHFSWKHKSERARNTLLNRDREFASVASNQGFAKMFSTYATNDVRLFREDNNPFVGKEASARALTSGKGRVTGNLLMVTYRSQAIWATHGTYDTVNDDGTKKLIEHGNYLRIWKRRTVSGKLYWM